MCGETRNSVCSAGCNARSCRFVNTNSLRTCCNISGCCCNYQASCRNPYWPEFAHPTWLSCDDLYDGNRNSCYEAEENSCGCD